MNKKDDIKIDFKVNLDEAILGTRKTIQFKKFGKCLKIDKCQNC
jgi:hypothetical protein